MEIIIGKRIGYDANLIRDINVIVELFTGLNPARITD
jgi:hypothetical protein